MFNIINFNAIGSTLEENTTSSFDWLCVSYYLSWYIQYMRYNELSGREDTKIIIAIPILTAGSA